MENQNQQTQIPPSPNQIPSPVNTPSRSKIVLIVLGVASVVMITIGVYVLGTKQTQPPVQNIAQETPTPTPTPDPTANWKTYTSSLDGYQIKYPRNFMDCSNEIVKGRFELRQTSVCADGEG